MRYYLKRKFLQLFSPRVSRYVNLFYLMDQVQEAVLLCMWKGQGTKTVYCVGKLLLL